MTNNIKLLIPIFSRANYSRCKSIIKSCSDYSIEPIIALGVSAVVTDFGDISQECGAENIVVSYKIDTLLQNKSNLNMVKTTSLTAIEIGNIINISKPDCVITIADRHETISSAIAASYMNIPLIHLQGGEPTGSIDDKVRNAIAQLSDYHLVCTQEAYARTLRWGEDENRIFNVGCPSLDHVNLFETKSKALEYLFLRIDSKQLADSIADDFVIFMYHPVTTEVFQDYDSLLKLVSEFCVANKLNLIILHPNPDAGSESFRKSIHRLDQSFLNSPNLYTITSHLSSDIYTAMLQASVMLVGNSSSGIRECSYLGVKVVNIGARQNLREQASNVIDCKSTNDLKEALHIQFNSDQPPRSYLYGEGKSGALIAKTISTLNLSLKTTKY